MNRVILGERAKITEKWSHPEHYGRVGVLVSVDAGDGLYCVRFDTGEVASFKRDELRVGVRAHG